MDDHSHLDRLNRLLDAQFDEVLYRMRVPIHALSPSSAPRGVRAIELLRWIEQEPGERGPLLERVLALVLSPAAASSSPGGEARLLIQAIDRHPEADSADVSLDWVDLFDGPAPSARRQLRDPGQWNTRLWPDLCEAESRIRAGRASRVVIDGFMRLSIGFAAGYAFSDKRRFEIVCPQRGQRWSSADKPADFVVESSEEVLGEGPDLALALSVTNDVSLDVAAYLKTTGLPAGTLLHIAAPALGPRAIPGAPEALGWALQVRKIARRRAADLGARRVHLFLSGPLGGAMLLGHFWSLLPTTQVYEHLAPGYAPSFLFPEDGRSL